MIKTFSDLLLSLLLRNQHWFTGLNAHNPDPEVRLHELVIWNKSYIFKSVFTHPLFAYLPWSSQPMQWEIVVKRMRNWSVAARLKEKVTIFLLHKKSQWLSWRVHISIWDNSKFSQKEILMRKKVRLFNCTSSDQKNVKFSFEN